MSTNVDTFLARARAGGTVYITEVRRAFEALPPDQRFRFGLGLTLPDGRLRRFVLTLPRFAVGAANPAQTFIEEYFLAELYNRLSALGPRALEFRSEPGTPEAVWLYRRFEEAFGLGHTRKDRRGYGRAVNVLERMVDSLEGTTGSRMTCRFTEGRVEDAPAAVPARKGAALEVARRALAGVAGRTLLGIDVGGSDIKLALSIDGRLAALKEYDWFPAQFTRIASLTDPIEALVRLMTWKAVALGADGSPDPALDAVLAPAFAKDADDKALRLALDAAEPLVARRPTTFKLDGIGHSFPDVVVRDKIVGGEVYKTRGIRDNAALDYESEFRGLTDLDERLRPYLKDGARVATVNDGPMAAFTALVEGSLADPASVEHGIFAHTLGTELGTGWVTEEGLVPDIPLEVYNFIIDLGSYPERAFACDDPRSVKNFNTDLPGTLQKYTSQSGAFRLALKSFPTERADLMREILEKGFVVAAGPSSMRIPSEPKDLRKPFLEYLMGLPDRGGQPSVNRIFTDIGEFLAVATLECNQILNPSARPRILFGRMVKNPRCFELMREGARRIDPAIELVQAADDIAVSKLMKELKADPHHTVAQFAQAVGAIYYAASRG